MACPTCGREPRSRSEALQQPDDLAVVWLHQDHPSGPVSQHQHCVACQPHGDCAILDCARCGDGPILTGTLANQVRQHGSSDLPAALHNWLADHRWQLNPDLLCPDHRP